MEAVLSAIAGGLGILVLGLLGLTFRSNGSNGALKRIDLRTEEMVSLLRLIADRGERSRG